MKTRKLQTKQQASTKKCKWNVGESTKKNETRAEKLTNKIMTKQTSKVQKSQLNNVLV